ncbi:MAG: hypothetical protein HY760_01250 [Nitrospirae bacterium]|nr:hypothetical protein [Nitrospirota bacterium]
MYTLAHEKALFLVLISCVVALSCLADAVPLSYAQEVNAPPKNIKGFFQVDLSAGVAARTVVEDISPGVHFEGDAVSTRVLARVAFKPWSPLEIYLQGGTANLDIDEFNGFRGNYGSAYGGGAGLALYEDPGPGRFRFLIQGDTLHFTTSDHVLTTIASQDVLVEEKIRWREYTLQGTGIWRVDRLEPYLGVRFSWLDADDTIDDPRVGRVSLEEDGNLGLVAGANLYLDPRENFAFHFEVTMIDQAALKVGVQVWY